MRKNFLILMLMTLLPLAGFAQRNVGDVFPADAYVYQVLATMVGDDPGEVALVGVRDNWTATDPTKAMIQDGALVIPASMSADLFGDTYTFNVVQLGTDVAIAAKGPFANPLQTRLDATGTVKGTFTGTAAATSVVIPQYIKALPAGCFNGYTNIQSISFAANSELETIANGAFATTQITTFDFTNCTNLASLPNAVFVENAPATNSYITTITLPAASPMLKHIGTAFQRLSKLTAINNLDKSAITEVVENAFAGCASLETVALPNTVEEIEKGAFADCGVKNLTIDVTALQAAGDGTDPVYGANVTKLESLTLKGDLGGVIKKNAFKGSTNLKTLNVSQLNFASKGQIAQSAFEGCTHNDFKSITFGDINDQPTGGFTIEDDAFKGCTKLESVTFGKINSANAIDGKAFNGCTKLATVTLGDVLAAGAIGDNTNPVFGTALKTVTIGTVKAGNAAIKAAAFKYADVSGTVLNLASAAGKNLSSDDASTPIIAAGAFDFSAVTNAGDAATFVGPVINIGEILSKGGVFTGADITLPAAAAYSTQIKLNFTGNIAQGGIDANVVSNQAKIDAITFSGDIATGGIEANAFSGYTTQKMTITFAGSLAKEAIMAGAFEKLYGNADGELGSQIKLTGTPADVTVNPFEKTAFDATTPAVVGTVRDIWLTVTNTELKAKFQSATKGLTTDGTYDVYRVDFYVAPVPADNTFLAYQNANQKSAAWARINFSTDKLSETLNGGAKNLKIQRYQKVKDGDTEVDAKLTLYATYTDEDDAEKVSTIYMVPLKVYDGYYELAKTDNEVIIAKVAKLSGDFTNTDIKVPVTTFDADLTNESLWTGLTNTELHIAQNVMTNQQLVDKTASDGGTPVDIYRGAAVKDENIAEDLYVMTDPAKYGGFEIKKIVITRGTGGKGAYIGEGWYYMLLKHYAAAAAAPAHVIWMDADPETDPNTTGIFEMKQSVKENAKNNGIYTLQGVRISAPQKGQIYIMNGKKYIAK